MSDETLATPRTLDVANEPLATAVSLGPPIPRHRAMAARRPPLPPMSPLFRKVNAADATSALRRLFKTDDVAFARALVPVRRKKPIRYEICLSAALFQAGAEPILGGWNTERVVSIHSLAKLAVLYAYYQLHADVAYIGQGIDLSDISETASKIKALTDAVAEAFEGADDPAVKALGQPGVTPRLSRLFDLRPFVTLGRDERNQDTLPLNTRSGQPQSNPDEWDTETRLHNMMHVSDNRATTSLMADIGIPYICALMERSGLAGLAEKKGGLWLAGPYGPWPSRVPPEPQAITATGIGVRATGGPSKGTVIVQAGSALGIATFMLLLYRGELVNEWASRRMRSTTVACACLDYRFRDRVPKGFAKVGIDGACRIFSEAALMPTLAKGAPSAMDAPVDWCAAVLDLRIGDRRRRIIAGLQREAADDRHEDANTELGDIGFDLLDQVSSLRAGVEP